MIFTYILALSFAHEPIGRVSTLSRVKLQGLSNWLQGGLQKLRVPELLFFFFGGELAFFRRLALKLNGLICVDIVQLLD